MNEESTPLELIMAKYVPKAVIEKIEAQVATIREPSKVIALGDLKTPVYGNDPDELLKNRFLYRGGILLFCGPTGSGKSAALIQAAMCWSVGKPFFGIMPGEIYQKKGMRILLVQAENDEGDLAEMRDGVLAGCDMLTDDEKALARRRIMVKTLADKSSEAFAEELDAILTQGEAEAEPYDLVIVDPALAYLGGDSNSQRDVSYFMRELLNPLLQRHKVGLVLVHHTNKPLRGKEKDGWAAGDFAYLGSGSAEWINPSRASLAIRSLGSENVFELRTVKRGQRLRWTDAEGKSTNVQYIAHHGAPGVICWRSATPEEVAEVTGTGDGGKGGRPSRFDEFECVYAVAKDPGESQSFYVEQVSGALGCGKETVRRLLKECVFAGWIGELGDQQFRRYRMTEKGKREAESRSNLRIWEAE